MTLYADFFPSAKPHIVYRTTPATKGDNEHENQAYPLHEKADVGLFIICAQGLSLLYCLALRTPKEDKNSPTTLCVE